MRDVIVFFKFGMINIIIVFNVGWKLYIVFIVNYCVVDISDVDVKVCILYYFIFDSIYIFNCFFCVFLVDWDIF